MGRERRLKKWHDIEAEFQEPVVDIIVGLREQGNSWRIVAGALEIALSTLCEWRRELGLPLKRDDKVFDPSSLPERTPTDKKAQRLGYRNATDAVLDMRLVQKLTLVQAAQILDVHPHTILHYTPRDTRGLIYNRSEQWWIQRRQWAADMSKRFCAKYGGYTGQHPFDKDNDILFTRRTDADGVS